MEDTPTAAPDAILTELSSAVSDPAKSADIAVKRMALRAQLTATIADTETATTAAHSTELAEQEQQESSKLMKSQAEPGTQGA